MKFFSLYFSCFSVSGEVTCMSCFALGDVSNLMMCTNCGHHYHGSCVGLALFPGKHSAFTAHIAGVQWF
jgi:hypothetical protein